LLFYQLISQIQFCGYPTQLYLLFKFIYRIIWDCSIYLSGVFNKGRVDFVRTKFWDIQDKHYISEALPIIYYTSSLLFVWNVYTIRSDF